LTFACSAAAYQFPQPCKHPGENARKKKKKRRKASYHTTSRQRRNLLSTHQPSSHEENAGRKETVTPHTNQKVIRKMQAERPQIRRIQSTALRKENKKKETPLDYHGSRQTTTTLCQWTNTTSKTRFGKPNLEKK
jgi:hypothetical protein